MAMLERPPKQKIILRSTVIGGFLGLLSFVVVILASANIASGQPTVNKLVSIGPLELAELQKQTLPNGEIQASTSVGSGLIVYVTFWLAVGLAWGVWLADKRGTEQ